MSDPVNLNHVRKARAKAADLARAAENRVKFGRTKAQKAADAAARAKADAALDHRRLPPGRER